MRAIPAAVATPVVGLLSPYVPGLTEPLLVQALEGIGRTGRPQALPECLTRAEFGRATRLSEASITRMIRDGRLPVVRFGRAVRIPRAAVEALVQVEGGEK